MISWIRMPWGCGCHCNTIPLPKSSHKAKYIVRISLDIHRVTDPRSTLDIFSILIHFGQMNGSTGRLIQSPKWIKIWSSPQIPMNQIFLTIDMRFNSPGLLCYLLVQKYKSLHTYCMSVHCKNFFFSLRWYHKVGIALLFWRFP